MERDLLVRDAGEPDVQPAVFVRPATRERHRVVQRRELEFEINDAIIARVAVGADDRAFVNERFPGFPLPNILSFDLREHRTAGRNALTDGLGEYLLQRVQIPALAAPIHLRPGPVNTAMMRMVHGPVLRERFAVETEERMDVIAPGAGVNAAGRSDIRQQVARFNRRVVVTENWLTGVGDVELTTRRVRRRDHIRVCCLANFLKFEGAFAFRPGGHEPADARRRAAFVRHEKLRWHGGPDR